MKSQINYLIIKNDRIWCDKKNTSQEICNKFAQDKGIKHQGCWNSAIKNRAVCSAGPWQGRKGKFLGLHPSHFFRLRKEHDQTNLGLFLGAGSPGRSRCISQLIYTLLLCPKFWVLSACVCLGDGGGADSDAMYCLLPWESERWFESSHMKVYKQLWVPFSLHE